MGPRGELPCERPHSTLVFRDDFYRVMVVHLVVHRAL
jgi:hypothetical protein